ncbi:beta-1,3-galactosyltransferase 5-like [Liolophura sinensis]|uniref:beta-1,3-galactosyltransferase 5-like n=1 Tax=Liolophura sinensis TaxID=3198878 RepID=UPI0031592243
MSVIHMHRVGESMQHKNSSEFKSPFENAIFPANIVSGMPGLNSLEPLDVENARSYNDIFGSDKVVQKIYFPFLIPSVHLCSRGHVLVLIYIHSALTKRQERDRIRQSWGSVNSRRGQRLVHAFLLGTSRDQKIMDRVRQESDEYGDIVQGDFHDSYRNLTYKNLMGLKWTLEYCPKAKFIMKVDDDTLIDPYHLINFLLDLPLKLRTKEDFLYCSVMIHIGVPQNLDDKWHIPAKEYPYRYYPAYCEGFGYILSIGAARKLLDMAAYVPYFWIDDVYVTGFLPYRLHMQPSSTAPGHGVTLMTPQLTRDLIRNNIMFLAKNSFYSKNWEETWNKIKDLHR